MKNKTVKIILIMLIMGLFWVLNGGKVYAWPSNLPTEFYGYTVSQKKECRFCMNSINLMLQPEGLVATFYSDCENDGWLAYLFQCSMCENYFWFAITDVDSNNKATGHNYQYVKTIAPTCTEKGYDKYKCSKCDKTKKENYKSATGHSYNTFVEDIVPTCTTAGGKKYVCSCGEETIKDIVPALGHSWEWVTTTEPTCVKSGVKTQICQREGCIFTGRTATISETGEHSYTATAVIEPTCQAKGYTKHTCSSCGKTYNDNYTDIVNHSYIFKKEQKLTCEYNHFKYYECKWCNKGKYENIEYTTGHKWEGTECSVCGETASIVAGPWDISNNTNSNVKATLYEASSRRGN